jgi:lysozyme family protein
LVPQLSAQALRQQAAQFTHAEFDKGIAMRQTYNEAMEAVYRDEGGYSNDAGDAGGPTKYGITIHDARLYWKPDASAADVKAMPKTVAADIYEKHYAIPLNYDALPAGVDYAVLDYGINSGINRANPVYKRVSTNNAVDTINAIYDERVAFLKAIVEHRPSQSKFLSGWMSRCSRGRKLALNLNAKYGSKPVIGAEHGAATGTVLAGAATATQYPHLWPYILAGTVAAAILLYTIIKFNKGK